jgi:hypothetical protein
MNPRIHALDTVPASKVVTVQSFAYNHDTAGPSRVDRLCVQEPVQRVEAAKQAAELHLAYTLAAISMCFVALPLAGGDLPLTVGGVPALVCVCPEAVRTQPGAMPLRRPQVQSSFAKLYSIDCPLSLSLHLGVAIGVSLLVACGYP